MLFPSQGSSPLVTTGDIRLEEPKDYLNDLEIQYSIFILAATCMAIGSRSARKIVSFVLGRYLFTYLHSKNRG